MTDTYVITAARPSDLAFLPSIELAAARLLVGHAPESVLCEVTSDEELRAAQSLGHLWVALHDDVPVGFAHVKLIEPASAHLDELDVHPEHGRRGIGRRLVTAVHEWARDTGYDAVTLCTFRDVPFNMPFYASLGFTEVPLGTISAPLGSIVELEVRRGLDTSRRLVMRATTRASGLRSGPTHSLSA